MNNRIRTIRQQAGLTQESFGARLGITKSSVSLLESGRNSPSDQTIKLICTEFGVNEKWLRTNEGKMTTPLSEANEVATFVSDLVGDTNNELYILIREIMHTYNQLDGSSKTVLRKFSRNLLENLQKSQATVDSSEQGADEFLKEIHKKESEANARSHA